MPFNRNPIVLASASPTRKSMLLNAGLQVDAIKPLVNEEALHRQFNAPSPKDLALKLAEAKALSLTTPHIVIGADQTMEFQGQVKHKAKSKDEAIGNLKAMSGKSHHLHSAVCLASSGRVIFNYVETATLHMRPLSDSFIAAYVREAQDAMLQSVGGYHYEGRGIQLFEKVDGDMHAILGLPLLPLLAFLRQAAIIAP